MKFHFCFLTIFLIVLPFFIADAQTAGLDQSVLMHAEVFENPPQIKLKWHATVSQCQGFTISRKKKTDSGFTDLKTISGTALSFVDSNVQVGVEYEYKVFRFGSNAVWGGPSAWGFVSAGIKIEPDPIKGNILLLVDSNLVNNPLTKNAIWRWKQDVAGEGWDVTELRVLPSDPVVSVKQRLIRSNRKKSFRSVFILGKVPIPYSGIIAPDDHNDHRGAWPADGFYSDSINQSWPDVSVNITSSSDPRNRNIPGDGKFDNSVLSNVHFEVGRVDMRNLPMFNLSEAALIKRYLDKNHKFRTREIKVTDRCMHDDQSTGLNFGATAWRGYSTLCRNRDLPLNPYIVTSTGNFRTTLKSYDYIWSGSWGPGSYTSCGSNQSGSFALDSFRTVFTSFIGSYFGDWDSPSNNFLRSALANKGPILTTCWSGRPFWYFHHMNMGEPIGYSTKVTMKNTGVYISGPYANQVHISLLGDPTLKLHPIKKIENLAATFQTNTIGLTWAPPENDTIDGYHVFKKNESDKQFYKISKKIITGTTFIDSCPLTGVNYYMVRPIRLEGANTGTYWNYGTGTIDTILVSNGVFVSIDTGISFACAGKPVSLSASANLPMSGSRFHWYLNNQLLTGGLGNSFTFPQILGSDSIKVGLSSRLGCWPQAYTLLSGNQTLKVKPIVIPGIQLSSDQGSQGICMGKPIRFYTLTSGAGSSPAFRWFVNGTLQNGTDSIFSSSILMNHDTIKSELTSNADCAFPTKTISQGLAAKVISNPEAVFQIAGNQLIAQNSGNSQIKWLLNGIELPGANDTILEPTASGQYVLILNNSGCLDSSASQLFTYIGVNGQMNGNDLTVYPNPASQIIQIEAPDFSNEIALISILDAYGKEIFISNQPIHETIKIAGFSPGFYTLSASIQGKKWRKIFVKNN